MRVLFVLLLFFVVVARSDEECPNVSQSLWSNLVNNLDQMFWTPFLQRYSLVRYASHPVPLRPETAFFNKDKIPPRSCREMGITNLLDVVCIQLAAQLGATAAKPCYLWARPALAASMGTLLECPRQAWADNQEVAKSLNRTLQVRQHCVYASRALQCSLLQFHWVVPWLMGALLMLVLGIAFCGGTICCLGCCCSRQNEDF